MRKWAFWALVFIFSSVVLAAPTAIAIRRQGEIQLDGKLEEPAWQQAPWHGDFVSASAAVEGQNPPAAVQTRFKVLFDEEALYVGIECDEPQLDKIVARYTEHDQDVYQDDCVEIFLAPSSDGRYYYHFVINSKGAYFDDFGADYGLVHAKLWEFPLQVGTALDPAAQKWRVEARIAFAGLDIRESAPPEWLFNVTRERYAGGAQELSTWSPLKGNFHAPRLFGKLTGLKADFRRFAWNIAAPQITISGDGSGRHQLSLKTNITNNTAQSRRILLSAHPFLRPEAAVQSEPQDLAAGATALFALPPVMLAGSPRQAVIQFNILDADTKQPLKIAVKHLDTEYRPLSLDIIQPNYRQNIYATQNVSEIIFRVTLAPDVAAQSAQIQYSLLNAAGQIIREGKAAKGQWGAPLKLEAARLPQGIYTLRARALNATGQTIHEIATTIRKLPPAQGSEVRIDEKGNILVNGQPKIFIGWYGSIPTEDPRPDVVALQNVQTPVVLIGPDPKPVREAFARGVYSIVSIEPGRLYHTFSWWRNPQITLHQEITKQDAPSEEFISYLKQLVDCVKNEPGLLGYYLADEPEINNARSAYLEAIYQRMQELDPYHPVFITNDTLDGIVTHGYRACDILNPDPYSPEPEYVPNFMKRCQEVLRRGQTIMMTPWHSSGQAHFMTAWGTAPPYSYRTMRMQYLQALAYGCRGFTGYTSAFFMPEIELRYGLPHIWREVRLLEPALANPLEKPLAEADAEMITWAGRGGAHIYLIVANHKPGTRRVKISCPALAPAKQLYVVSEGRIVPVTKGSFTDRFAPGEARIYTTNPQAAQLPTMQEIEKELAERKAASAKPGNLLHYARGIRARASEGYYAPWFHQYYYYACNGLTDDLGWHLSHTDKPAWLEIALPEAKNIGRVVLYTPNLRDYDLQFQGPEGRIVVAEIRGNAREVAEHHFQPPIPTLKLRLTALAVRGGEGTKNAIVREIEAYEQPGAEPPTPVKAVETGAPPLVFTPPPSETQGEPVLWKEAFQPFETAPRYYWDERDTKWVLNAEKLLALPLPEGGIVLASQAPEGYAGMTHFFPYNPEFRYFQASLRAIEGEGYRWTNISLNDGSGKLPVRTAVHTRLPGLYTVDTHYLHEQFRQGTLKRAFVSVFVAGSGRNEDGSVRQGPRFTFDFLQLVRRPTNGLIITMADGSPVPPALKAGDTLLYRVYLEKPAQDVVVETLGGAGHEPLLINREPSVQLWPVGDKDGRQWAALVTLGPGTSKFTPQGYPVLFRAVITGGALPALYVTMDVTFE